MGVGMSDLTHTPTRSPRSIAAMNESGSASCGPLPVLDLAERLAGLPAEEFTPAGVSAYLQLLRVEAASLAPYILFDPRRYTRNLVYRCSRFELLSLCWEPGQMSAIHNHAGQQ